METKDILLCGVGGQGTVLASKLLAQCAINLTVVNGDAVCAACGSPKVLNLALLGAAAKGGVLGFTAEELCRVIDEKIPERFRALNKKAIALSGKV